MKSFPRNEWEKNDIGKIINSNDETQKNIHYSHLKT